MVKYTKIISIMGGEILMNVNFTDYIDDRFDEFLGYLEALTDPHNKWKIRRANKEHEDLFGIYIKPHERYFFRRIGQGWHSYVKVSSKSMGIMLDALFSGDHHFQTIASQIKKNIDELEREKLREVVKLLEERTEN